MNRIAKLYLGTVIALGAASFFYGMSSWAIVNPTGFAVYLILSIPASCLKVRLPGFEGTMSIVFVFLLAGISELNLAETLVIGCISIAVQCLWNTQTKPRAVQVIFSLANICIAITVTNYTYHAAPVGWASTRLLFAATMLFFANTLPLAMAIALAEGQSFQRVWLGCYLWCFPYHLIGAAIVVAIGFSPNWQLRMLVVPIMYVIYRSYRLHVGQIETEKKRAADEIRHRQEKEVLQEQTIAAVRRQMQLQSDFVSAVSHEFRSPITSLRGITELLKDDRMPEESRSEGYLWLERETTRLGRLVEDLLDFAGIEAGKKTYSLDRCDLAELVANAVAETAADIEARGFCVRLEIAGTPKARIVADRRAFRCAMRNLIDNAMKYSPHCSIIWVRTRISSTHGYVSVHDRGIGIPREQQTHVFQKFVRGEAAKAAGIKGTGIGLTLARESVRGMGGDILLESQEGVGSTFDIVLPLAKENAERA